MSRRAVEDTVELLLIPVQAVLLVVAIIVWFCVSLVLEFLSDLRS